MDVTFSPALRVYAEMWEIAGRRRAADAQFSQALTHIRSGTPDAMAKAFDLFKRSGAHNFTEAQFAAGWCCEHGCGTKRNYPQAIRWYKRAENNVTSDVMSAFDPVGEAENARLRLYFECESYAAAVDALLDAIGIFSGASSGSPISTRTSATFPSFTVRSRYLIPPSVSTEMCVLSVSP